jgi:hypothetical protein
MTDKVRCPSCRGAKKVPKLGGMIGECNTCMGNGNILASDKPKPVSVEPVMPVNTIVKAVADSVPSSTVANIDQDVKVDPKRALYKRKSS